MIHREYILLFNLYSQFDHSMKCINGSFGNGIARTGLTNIFAISSTTFVKSVFWNLWIYTMKI